MFQKTKQLCRKAFGFVNGIPTKVMMFSFMLLSGMVAKAQNSAGDYSAGTSALSTVAEEIYFCQNQTKYHTFNFILKAYNNHSFSTIYNDMPYFNNT